jgi:hypothetical protein
MGILTRKQGERFVITSDRAVNEAISHRAPKTKPADAYRVWTGAQWSEQPTEAATFGTLDGADDYVRANMSQIMK